jgi:hypothetical protein
MSLSALRDHSFEWNEAPREASRGLSRLTIFGRRHNRRVMVG